MASSSELPQSLPRKRYRYDLPEACSDSLCSDRDELPLKRLHTNPAPASSPSSQSSCVSVCDAFFVEQDPAGSCVEAGVTSQVEAADSTNGSCLAFHEVESKDSTSAASACGLDYSFTACTSQEQQLRRTFSEGAESCSGEDAQVDVNCFLKDWDEDVDGLGFNPADVFKNKLQPSSEEESSDAVFTPDSDALGVSIAALDNEDWFLSDLGCDGQIYWNEAQDQEWMTTAVANLDRINDAFATDASMLQLLEAGPGS